MKKSTKFWVGVGAAVGGVWAWMRYGHNLSPSNLAAARVAPPGYTSTRYLTDASGKQVAMVFIYPTVAGKTMTFTVPIDASQKGYYGTL